MLDWEIKQKTDSCLRKIRELENCLYDLENIVASHLEDHKE